MVYDFDRVIERRGTDSYKWHRYGEDVLPLWVADMDFESPQPVIDALRRRADQGIFGYPLSTPELGLLIRERLKRFYDWEVRDDEVLFLPGIVTGLNLAFQVYAGPGEEILVQPPVYSHFITDPVLHGRVVIDPPLVESGDTYEIDFDVFEESITPQTRLFVLCNPHNPVARVFRKDELERLAEICLRHNIIICSDEIHCDLIHPGHRHIPIATLGPEVADRTITFMAPSKTFNVPGLGFAFAVIRNPQLRQAWTQASQGLIPHVNLMGLTAAVAAYRDGQEWLDQVLPYLDANKRFLAQFVADRLPGIRMMEMEATYLAWLDCRQAMSGDDPGRDPFRFFLREARVALNDGAEFGTCGKGFVRLNFGCPRSTLTQALERMENAYRRLST